MDTKKKEAGTRKGKAMVHVTVLVVVASLALIAFLLANSRIDFVDFVIKLH